jgi:nicotinate-nucleotide adenylyltransferase
MRVGLFGGTFDPVHFGHLIMAEQCREQGNLDQVWFVLAPRPPHKTEQAITRFDQRAEMLQLAVAGHPSFRVEEIENELDGPSYTVRTVAELCRRHPDVEFWLLLGSDTLRDLPTWRDPEALLAQVGLLVSARPGVEVVSAQDLRAALPRLPPEVPVRLQVVESPLLQISSRDLRERAAAGRTIRYMVPRAVEVYIHEKKIYGKRITGRSQGSRAGDLNRRCDG